MKTIYKFKWQSYFSLIEGIFCAEKEDVEKAIGKQVYLGEVSGKHSEVYGDLDWEDLEAITDNPEAVGIFEDYDLTSGFNPLQYLDS